MSIETELFRNYEADEIRLAGYGFLPDGDGLVYVRPLPEDGFEIVVRFDGEIRGKIMDTAAGGEYANFRIEGASGYSAGIRRKFVDLLTDIRDRCFTDRHFASPQARRVAEFIRDSLGGEPEFLWEKFPDYAAFRRKDSRKWYALICAVERFKLDHSSEDRRKVEIINVKIDSSKVGEILSLDGYYPAFHMNKKSWVSVILDDTLPDGEIFSRIRESYDSL